MTVVSSLWASIQAEQRPVEERVVETLVEETSLEAADGFTDPTPPLGVSLTQPVDPEPPQ